MGSKYTKPSRQRNGGAKTFNCFSRPSVSLRPSASCDDNAGSFMSRVRSKFARPKSAFIDKSALDDDEENNIVPRSTTDQNLLIIQDQDEFMNDVRNKLITIEENNNNINNTTTYDDEEEEWKPPDNEVTGFVRVGQFAKSPAIYNLKDVASDDDELQISLSPNSTLTDGHVEASISSSITTPSPEELVVLTRVVTPEAQPLPPPPPPPPPTESSAKKKHSILKLLTRPLRLTRPFTRPPPKSSTLPAQLGETVAAANHKSPSPPSTARLSLSDGLIFIDDIDEDDEDIPRQLFRLVATTTTAANKRKAARNRRPPPQPQPRRRPSYFIEMERESIAMEQRCLRDNDTVSTNTISYVIGHAPLAQSESTTLANSRDNLINRLSADSSSSSNSSSSSSSDILLSNC